MGGIPLIYFVYQVYQIYYQIWGDVESPSHGGILYNTIEKKKNISNQILKSQLNAINNTQLQKLYKKNGLVTRKKNSCARKKWRMKVKDKNIMGKGLDRSLPR